MSKFTDRFGSSSIKSSGGKVSPLSTMSDAEEFETLLQHLSIDELRYVADQISAHHAIEANDNI